VGRHGGTVVSTPPAPSLGGRFVHHTLDLFERCRVAQEPDGSPARFRLTAAALLAVAAVRAADPGILESKEAAQTLGVTLDAILAGERCAPDNEPRAPGNTTHLSVVDAAGNAAAITLSHGEGNGHAVGDTGILMNNFLGESDLFPAGFFRIPPGTPIATMMAPTILQFPDGGVAALGTGGANRIRTVIPQVVTRLLDPSANLGSAVAAPRLHVESNVLSAETFQFGGDDTPFDKARTLVDKHSFFDRPSLFFGGVHIAVRRPNGELEGVADNRRGGVCRIVEEVGG
jgi:gamma-glutamyltranspeptidase/glutathione hydrolase